MALGRIRRNSEKRDKAYTKIHYGKRRDKLITVNVRVERTTTGYHSIACFRTRSNTKTAGRNGRRGSSCGGGSGRTPQSSVAKALKALSNKAATRGRKYTSMRG